MGTPAVFENRLYVPVISMEENAGGANYPCCTFRGSLVAMEAFTGTVIWQRFTIPAPAALRSKNELGVPQYGPSGAGLWSAPTIDERRRLIYFTTGNGYSEPGDDNSDAIFALDLDSGTVRWRTQTFASDNWNSWDNFCHSDPKHTSSPGCRGLKQPGPDIDFTTSPVLVHGEHTDILVAGRKDGTTFGIRADTGTIEWAERTSTNPDFNAGSLNFGLMAEGHRIFVPSAGTTFPNAGSLTPSGDDGLFALDAVTGTRLWSAKTQDDCERPRPCTGITFAPIGFPGVVFAGDTNGLVRAYETSTGRVLWRFDTARTFTTINGDQAKGGAISRNSIMIGNGMVYVGSGGSIDPGNVLLAFSIDGK
jgi:polyvinyl alcohol dehydrogenase (cytochrome)